MLEEKKVKEKTPHQELVFLCLQKIQSSQTTQKKLYHLLLEKDLGEQVEKELSLILREQIDHREKTFSFEKCFLEFDALQLKELTQRFSFLDIFSGANILDICDIILQNNMSFQEAYSQIAQMCICDDCKDLAIFIEKQKEFHQGQLEKLRSVISKKLGVVYRDFDEDTYDENKSGEEE
ncbi:MAG: hypothetical protein ACOCQQ_02145 [Candidatus Nanoarchaeia archaeon]